MQHKTVDVSVAVSLDTGLITPIIKNAANKGVAEISANMKVRRALARVVRAAN
jgi:pyruvate dehydrogenase E2 component (dihydrolipoamide acetyltransferase)